MMEPLKDGSFSKVGKNFPPLERPSLSAKEYWTFSPHPPNASSLYMLTLKGRNPELEDG